MEWDSINKTPKHSNIPEEVKVAEGYKRRQTGYEDRLAAVKMLQTTNININNPEHAKVQ